MTPRAFWELCRQHDWTYDFSDDGQVWKRGFEQERELLNAMAERPGLKPIYQAWKRHSYNEGPMPPQPEE